ncbi:MAG: energy-coupling factor ABC transporter permease [Kiritimatiellia bacterium]
MHLPSETLNPALCPLTWTLATAALGSALHYAKRQTEKPTCQRILTVAASLLVLQAVNFPIVPGISGHIIGAVFAARLLGIPFAMITTAGVLAVQAVLGDGGVDTLGANILNIAIVAPLVGGLIKPRALAGLASVLAAALSCGLLLALSGRTEVLLPLLALHLAIGSAEALFAAVALRLQAWAPLLLLPAIPFSSRLPDGLEAALVGLPVNGMAVALVATALAGAFCAVFFVEKRATLGGNHQS